MPQYGVQALTRKSTDDVFMVVLLTRKTYDESASVIDVYAGEKLHEVFFSMEETVGPNQLNFVVMPDGSWEEPDCLSTQEAFEATYGDKLFPIDP